MKEIEFRAKGISTNDWHYGYLTVFDGQTCIVKENGHKIAVDQDTVGRYTGYKDGEGNKIYAGDIVIPSGSTGDLIFEGSYCREDRVATNEKLVVLNINCGIVLRHISVLKYPKADWETPNMYLEGWGIIPQEDLWNHQKSLKIIGNRHEEQKLKEG